MVLLKKTHLIGAMVLASFVALFFVVFGEWQVVVASAALLIAMNLAAFFLTLPPEYMQWRAVRKVIECSVSGTENCIVGYPRRSYKNMNLLMMGGLSTVAMMAIAVLVDATIMRLPNLGFSVLACLLIGMLIIRLEIAWEIEAEGSWGV